MSGAQVRQINWFLIEIISKKPPAITVAHKHRFSKIFTAPAI
jgi:hypothetical protein